MTEEVSMGQNNPPPTIPPDDSIEETPQKILKFIWPSVVSWARKNLPPDIAREIPEDLLVVLWPGILAQSPELEGRTPPPDRPKRVKTPEEWREERKEGEFMELLDRLGEKIKARAPERSELPEEVPKPEPREKPSPESEKRVPRGEVIPLRKRRREKPEELPPVPRSVGRKFKLRWIDSSFWESRAFEGLALGARELYRILLTFSKRPGGGSRYRYCQIGIEQARGLLDRRKEDLLRTKRGERRKEALGIGITERSVRRYLEALKKRGLIIQVVRGRPSDPARDTSPYVSKYLVVVSERQRFKLTLDRKKGLGPRSRRSRRRPETLP